MDSLISPEVQEYAVRYTSPLPDYLEGLIQATQEQMEFPEMVTGAIEGTFLEMLVWTTNARRVLEIGMFTGFSAQIMAAALPDDGVLVTCEVDPKAETLAREYFRKSPHGHKIDVRMGPALETLKSLKGPFDLVFIDADKEPYIEYYEASLQLLAPKGLIIADNVFFGGRVLDSDANIPMVRFNEHIRRDDRVRNLFLPVRDGMMLIRRAN